MKLGEKAGGRANNFDVLRLAAAAMVLVSHSFVLSGGDEPRLGGIALGTFGVVVFFAISGFLIARSWTGGPALRGYTVKRALRIIPGLVLALVACAYLLGALVTTLSPSAYLGSFEPLDYVLGNLASVATGGLAGDIVYDLPGVFASNPVPDSVNGSLWTLPVEIQAYALVAALGALGLLARGMGALAVAGVALLALDGVGVDLPLAGRLVQERPESVLLLATFAVGALMWSRRDEVPLRLDAGLVVLVVWLGALATPLGAAATALAFPYLVLLAAYRSSPALARATRHGDVSYGLYVFAFPVQQAIILAWGGAGPGAAVLSAIALPITYLLAFASWRAVEAPALRLKGRLAAPRPRAPSQVAPATAGDRPPRSWL